MTSSLVTNRLSPTSHNIKTPLARLNARALHDPRVKIHNTNGFIFINRPGPLYDRVILDFPDPHNEAISKLYSEEFYTMLRRRMSPNGIVVAQSSSPSSHVGHSGPSKIPCPRSSRRQ